MLVDAAFVVICLQICEELLEYAILTYFAHILGGYVGFNDLYVYHGGIDVPDVAGSATLSKPTKERFLRCGYYDIVVELRTWRQGTIILKCGVTRDKFDLICNWWMRIQTCG